MPLTRRAALKLAGVATLGLAAGLRAAETKNFLVNGHPPADEVGLKILREGGNAIDAIVAAALVAAVTSPHNCGIGGYGGHMTLFLAKSKKTVSIDFNTAAPAAATYNMFSPGQDVPVPNRINEIGWLAAGVPGTLDGLQLALDRFGTKSLRDLLAPAIAFAENGFSVPQGMSNAIRARTPALQKDPASTALYFKNGQPLQVGELHRNPDLAKLLKKLAAENSVESFYSGDIGRHIAAEFQKHGGILTAQDMASYQAREVEPYRLQWRGYTIQTAPLTAGGISVLEALGILKVFNWHKITSPFERNAVLIEALRVAWSDRLLVLGDTDMHPYMADRVLSLGAAKKVAAWLRDNIKQRIAIPYKVVPRDHSGTIHINSVDSAGNVAALTLTQGDSFGACVTVAGLGLTLGQGMSRFEPIPATTNSPRAGKRPLNNMCPTLVFKNDKPILAIGGRGGRAILNALYNVLAHYVGAGKSIQESIAAPRFNTQGQLDITFEPIWPQSEIDALKAMRYQIKTGPSATIHAISIDPKTRACLSAAR